MKSYLSDRHQWVCVSNNFSSWEKMITGVPQGSILGPLLFNIFINDLFLFVSSSYLSNYADDNVFYASSFNLEEVKNVLQIDFDVVTRWFFKITRLLMPRNAISYVLERMQQMKLFFSKS